MEYKFGIAICITTLLKTASVVQSPPLFSIQPKLIETRILNNHFKDLSYMEGLTVHLSQHQFLLNIMLLEEMATSKT